MHNDAAGKPASGFRHYLRDMVYGSVDGVITTLAVISGASGAALDPRVGLILGVANLAADGLSMGASNYLGLKSELEQTGRSVAQEQPWRHGLATSVAFAVAGAVPLLAYLVPRPAGASIFVFAVLFASVALVIAGGLRGRLVGKAPWRGALEMLAIGLAASAAAYGIGAVVEGLTRSRRGRPDRRRRGGAAPRWRGRPPSPAGARTRR